MSSDSKSAAPKRSAGESLPGPGRVLITGAEGFVGRAVVAGVVQRGFEVAAVKSANGVATQGEAPVRWHTLDLLDSGAVADFFRQNSFDSLIHLAWAPNRGIYKSPDNYAWVWASTHLLEQFVGSGGRRAVFAGTSAEYDWGQGVCREGSTPLAGGGLYGAAKRALAELFAGRCELDGVSGAWARIFFLFGPREPETRLVAAVARALAENRVVECSEGSQVRDFLYVEDAADALISILASEVTGPINVGSGRPARVRDIVQHLVDLDGKDRRVDWGAVGGEEAPLVLADNKRLRQAVGWREQVGLKEGLARTLTWWRNQV